MPAQPAQSAQPNRSRVTDTHDGEVVVFLIGMRINRLRAVRQWWPTALAMPRMLKELFADPGSGLLGARTMVGGGFREITVVQYWKDADHLLAYAGAADRAHRPAWQAFNRQARSNNGAVGIWHETYVVPAGAHETVYVNMRPFGLGQASGTQPVASRGEHAAQRLNPAAE
ncbi:hypothetical protein P3T37_003800 [Kitasatospora sp. MAA4]|uniref:DUF4188 domain-containing protein n=1 Tax=Kitasatospora sp. MAA4 TaxID=3035093 RepID=UPI00247619C9|nr:DUF4188 domain-containing protein [Kitasatospora sp. MAA4]MDH6134397.1 hypothetical protein [Kitasatospora sp. MAA4]